MPFYLKFNSRVCVRRKWQFQLLKHSIRASSTSNEPDSARFVAAVTTGAWIAGGITTAYVLPSSIATSTSILCLAYFSSRAAQPLVNTKLAVQRLPSKSIKLTPQSFFLNEISNFRNQFIRIGLSQNAHRGGNIYALRGAFAKMLTFTGFDVMFSLLSPALLSINAPLLIIIPLSALISGLVQGSLIALPEYLSTLQSRYPEKSNKELYPLMWENVKKTNGLPILTVAFRNGLFDMVFNTMRVGLCLPFGPSAVIAMTANYPVERYRSLVHQNEIISSQTLLHNKNVLDHFQGWFSKALEFFTIYQLLQLFKELPSALYSS